LSINKIVGLYRAKGMLSLFGTAIEAGQAGLSCQFNIRIKENFNTGALRPTAS